MIHWLSSLIECHHLNVTPHRMKIGYINHPVFQKTSWRSIYLLHVLLVQIGSINTSSIQSPEPALTSNEPQIPSLESNQTEERWRLPEAFTLDDLRLVKTSNLSTQLPENFRVVSRDTAVSEWYPKAQKALAEEAFAFTLGDLLSIRYPRHSNPLHNQNPPRVMESTFSAAPLNITTAKNVTLSYSLFIPEGFDFLTRVKLPGIYGGSTYGENTYKSDEGFHTYVMIQEDGTVGFYTQNSKSNEHESFRGGSRSLSRGIWTTIRQDVWLDSRGIAIRGFNLWINHNLVSAQTDLSPRHLFSMKNGDLTEATHVTGQIQRVSLSGIENNFDKQQVPTHSDEREIKDGNFIQVSGDQLPAIENIRNLQEIARTSPLNNSEILRGQETTQQNSTQQPNGKNLTSTMAVSQNLTGVNDQTKNNTNTPVEHRDFGAFPALGIPELAELAKENSKKIVPVVPALIIAQPLTETDDDNDDDDDQVEDDNDRSNEVPESSSSNSKSKLSPFLGALGSILLQQEDPVDDQPLQFFGFFASDLSSATEISPKSKPDDRINSTIFFKDFQIICNPNIHAS
ncbi:hypothetical protein PGTUg99_037716 [Puccinia graminis f. sp. tritici]|uniref:Polysaccharide lyase 14 domain-containing protein n=1 Tax=Puccinia graminis f. sp. tritici TaxID=56615 RepID=A0A5B0RBV4_PUCGR|nr:hypothetical protein PGTUg99_037716 [Puccinia graminis f. sp. tritici]